MTNEQEEHLTGMTQVFNKAIRIKYEQGAKEHGGFLWEKEGLLDEALNEVLDLWTYLYTLREQLTHNRPTDI